MGDESDYENYSYDADDPGFSSLSSVNKSFLDDTQFSGGDESVDVNEDSFSAAFELADAILSSTPQKTSATKRAEKNNNLTKGSSVEPFKAPCPKAKSSHLVKCHLCGATLKTMKTYNNHLLTHKWKELAAKIPSTKGITDLCQTEIESILVVMSDVVQPGPCGKEFNSTAKVMLEKKNTPEFAVLLKRLTEIVTRGVTGVDVNKRTLIFAPSCRKFLIEYVNTTLNNHDIRDDLLEMLLRVNLCSTQAAYPFLFSLTRRLGNAVLSKIFAIMSSRDQRWRGGAKRSKDDFHQLKSQKIIHYICGSALRSLIRHAYTYPDNKRLQRRKMCILKKFGCIGEPTVCQPTDRAYWTSLLNRKALFFLKEENLPFFVDLALLLQQMEKPGGSLGHAEVMDEVSKTPSFLSKWSAIVGCELSDDESFDMMVKVIRLLTNTFGRGVLNRRMNNVKKGRKNKATISVSHRARLL